MRDKILGGSQSPQSKSKETMHLCSSQQDCLHVSQGAPVAAEETDFGQSRFGHRGFGPANFGQNQFWPIQFGPIQFGPIQFGPIQFWIWCVMVVLQRVESARWGPASPGGPPRQPKNSKRAHFTAPALQTQPKFHEWTPKREKKERKLWREKGKKKAEFWAPHLRGPTLRGPTFSRFGLPPFGAHPTGPHLFQVWAPTLRGFHPSGPTLRGSPFRAPTLRGPPFLGWAPTLRGPTHRAPTDRAPTDRPGIAKSIGFSLA